MKRFLIAVSGAAMVAAPAFAEMRSFEFDGFEGVSVAAGIEAEISVGGEYAVRADSSEEGLEQLRIDVDDGVLEIGRKRMGLGWKRGKEIKVQVSLPALTSLDVSSGANVKASGVTASAFDLDISSGAHAEVAGTCGALNLDISSGAHLDARTLECASINADASTGAHAEVFASESVNADASTGAAIDVWGEPESVSKDTSTGGSVSVK